MPLELRRVRGDRRRYVLDDLGGLRVSGIVTRRATAAAAGEVWNFRRRGRAAQATDRAGAVAGVYTPIPVGRGGTLRWGDREVADDADHELGLLLFVAFVVRGLAEYAAQ